jgi:ABC-type cobalamin/Fe3+-siderophores transport system ATPase subunit
LLERWLAGSGAPHLAIVGRSGAGKTTLTKKIIGNLLNNTSNNKVVLDFDNEYSDLPLQVLTPPFPLPRGVSLSWLLSQAVRPFREEGGGFGISGLLSLFLFEDDEDNMKIDEMITRVKTDHTIPFNIRFAALWRLNIIKKFFVFDNHDYNSSSSRFDLSMIPDIRERQVVEQILASLIIDRSPGPLFLVIEEGVPGEWLSDVLMLARRRGVRIIYVSQSLPPSSVLPSFEVVFFTPYFNTHPQLPLPINPSLDRGVWWIGALGVHRLSLG